MVKKLRLKESVNTMPDNVYDSITLLGYTCALAANDFHHIHLCAEGDKFQEIHECADKYLADVREFGDICLELAKEGNIELMNETYALDILKDNGGSNWQVADKASYNFTEAFTDMSNILSDLTQGITLIEEMDGVTSDVISVMDEWARKFSKEVNYFIAKKLGKDDEVLVGQVESVNRKMCKSLKESSYKDSNVYKEVTNYPYGVDVKPLKFGKYEVSITFDDGDLYTKYTLIAPTDDELADGLDEWLVKDEHNTIINERFDYYPTNLDEAVVCALQHFWGSY